jgi:predicted ATP-binding protein involved in virulence
MTCIRRIALPDGFRNIPPIEIDLAPGDGQPFRHLILTGPNGSGKSSLLELVGAVFKEMKYGNDVRAGKQSRHAHVVWDSSGTLPAIDSLRSGKSVLVYLKAQRTLQPDSVPGPRTQEDLWLNVEPKLELSRHFLQFLVNMHTERAYAQVDGDQDAVRRIDDWFEAFTKHLRWLMDDPGLGVRFDRANFNFVIRRSSGFEFDLRTLADGHASVISILAELFLRVDACRRVVGDRSYQPDGVVIIDEIETHLHLRLQEQILPFLTELMPRLQFLVATHSPAVISSIPNAVVYDLGTCEQVLSEELRGIRYGTLMTEHFGIESDMDVDSTEKLERAQELLRKQPRTEEEDRELSRLATELSGRSSTLALELWEAKEQSEARGD